MSTIETAIDNSRIYVGRDRSELTIGGNKIIIEQDSFEHESEPVTKLIEQPRIEGKLPAMQPFSFEFDQRLLKMPVFELKSFYTAGNENPVFVKLYIQRGDGPDWHRNEQTVQLKYDTIRVTADIWDDRTVTCRNIRSIYATIDNSDLQNVELQITGHLFPEGEGNYKAKFYLNDYAKAIKTDGIFYPLITFNTKLAMSIKLYFSFIDGPSKSKFWELKDTFPMQGYETNLCLPNWTSDKGNMIRCNIQCGSKIYFNLYPSYDIETKSNRVTTKKGQRGKEMRKRVMQTGCAEQKDEEVTNSRRKIKISNDIYIFEEDLLPGSDDVYEGEKKELKTRQIHIKVSSEEKDVTPHQKNFIHENIVSMITNGKMDCEREKPYFFVMEKFECTLGHYLSENPELEHEEKINILRQLSKALQYLESQGITSVKFTLSNIWKVKNNFKLFPQHASDERSFNLTACAVGVFKELMGNCRKCVSHIQICKDWDHGNEASRIFLESVHQKKTFEVIEKSSIFWDKIQIVDFLEKAFGFLQKTGNENFKKIGQKHLNKYFAKVGLKNDRDWSKKLTAETILYKFAHSLISLGKTKKIGAESLNAKYNHKEIGNLVRFYRNVIMHCLDGKFKKEYEAIGINSKVAALEYLDRRFPDFHHFLYGVLSRNDAIPPDYRP